MIVLGLGHESIETTQMHLHVDMAIKEKALGRTTKTNLVPTRYRPADQLLAFLESSYYAERISRKMLETTLKMASCFSPRGIIRDAA